MQAFADLIDLVRAKKYGRIMSAFDSLLIAVLVFVVGGCGAKKVSHKRSVAGVIESETEAETETDTETESGGATVEPVELAAVEGACPNAVPEGFPYFCKIKPIDTKGSDISPSDVQFSLVENTCEDLVLDGVGVIRGLVPLPNGFNCSFRVKGVYSNKAIISNTFAVVGSPRVLMSLSKMVIDIEVGGSTQVVDLNFSAPTPYLTQVPYEIWGEGNVGEVVAGLGAKGYIEVPAGTTSQSITLSVPSLGLSEKRKDLSLVIDPDGLSWKTVTHLNVFRPEPTAFTVVSVGSEASCAVDTDTNLWCWGSNNQRAVGIGETDFGIIEPTKIGSSGWTHVSIKSGTACGINSGRAFCWGRVGNGQGGTGPINPVRAWAPAPEEVTGGYTDWTYIDSFSNTTCGIRNKQLFCWGSDLDGRLGLGAGDNSSGIPLEVSPSLTNWTHVSVGWGSVCAIESQNLYCWGSDLRYTNGNGSANTSAVEAPEEIGLSVDWKFVQVGVRNACAIAVSGELYCWGQLYNGTGVLVSYHEPTQVGTDSDWVYVANNSSVYASGAVCAVKLNGNMYCWGSNSDFILPGGPNYLIGDVLSPVLVEGGEQWKSVSVNEPSCGITQSGKMKCWGRNGQGRGVRDLSGSLPRKVQTQSLVFDSIAGKYDTFCGIKDEVLYCRGRNSRKIVAPHVESGYVEKFVRVTLEKGWSKISPSQSSICGIRDKKLYCWGSGSYGILGNGDYSGREIIEQVGVLSNWQDVEVGEAHTCGIESGHLYCWGRDYNGALGNSSASSSSVYTPMQIGTDSDWVKVFVHTNTSCALKQNLTLFCWGDNSKGHAGVGSASTQIDDPTLISGISGWTHVASSGDTTCGVADGNAYCWGVANQTGTGDLSTTHIISPVQLSGTGWSKVIPGGQYSSVTCGLKNGQVFCWGLSTSSYGQMGTGTSTPSRATPMDPLNLSNKWTDLYLGRGTACGIDGGQLTCWGVSGPANGREILGGMFPKPVTGFN